MKDLESKSTVLKRLYFALWMLLFIEISKCYKINQVNLVKEARQEIVEISNKIYKAPKHILVKRQKDGTSNLAGVSIVSNPQPTVVSPPQIPTVSSNQKSSENILKPTVSIITNKQIESKPSRPSISLPSQSSASVPSQSSISEPSGPSISMSTPSRPSIREPSGSFGSLSNPPSASSSNPPTTASPAITPSSVESPTFSSLEPTTSTIPKVVPSDKPRIFEYEPRFATYKSTFLLAIREPWNIIRLQNVDVQNEFRNGIVQDFVDVLETKNDRFFVSKIEPIGINDLHTGRGVYVTMTLLSTDEVDEIPNTRLKRNFEIIVENDKPCIRRTRVLKYMYIDYFIRTYGGNGKLDDYGTKNTNSPYIGAGSNISPKQRYFTLSRSLVAAFGYGAIAVAFVRYCRYLSD